MLQIFADYFLPQAIGSPNKQKGFMDENSSNSRAIMLLKKIELSKGYELYRRERLMEGVAKPPILLAHDSNKIKGVGSSGSKPLLKAKVN
jgi:hypothetical protein